LPLFFGWGISICWTYLNHFLRGCFSKYFGSKLLRVLKVCFSYNDFLFMCLTLFLGEIRVPTWAARLLGFCVCHRWWKP
jgi:hypothetical protein